MLRVTAGMEDLQQDFRAVGVYLVGDCPQLIRMSGSIQHRSVRLETSLGSRRETSGHDYRCAACRTGGIESSLAPQRLVQLLQARMHGAHDDAIAQGMSPDAQW
jgi:hypothetical protein